MDCLCLVLSYLSVDLSYALILIRNIPPPAKKTRDIGCGVMQLFANFIFLAMHNRTLRVLLSHTNAYSYLSLLISWF